MESHEFAMRVKAVTWAVIEIALSLYALYAFAAGLPWVQFTIPAVLAVVLSPIEPGARRVR